MRFLIDNALSPLVAEALHRAGHQAVHVRERGLHAAPDDVLFDLAAREQRVLVSVDTDFAMLLASRQAGKPSVILFRRDWHVPMRQVAAILNNFSQIEDSLNQGAIVTFDRERVRIRDLPIHG